MTRTTRRNPLLALLAAPMLLGALAATATDLQAQRPTRRQAPIEIRGQVPTPQVVTVRPREVPTYERRFLVPNFYDHDFWQAILPGYQLVSGRLITGNTRLDSLAGTDSARAAEGARTATSDSLRARAAIGIGLFPRRLVADTANLLSAPRMAPPATPPGGTRFVPADTTRPPAAPADTSRSPRDGAAAMARPDPGAARVGTAPARTPR